MSEEKTEPLEQETQNAAPESAAEPATEQEEAAPSPAEAEPQEETPISTEQEPSAETPVEPEPQTEAPAEPAEEEKPAETTAEIESEPPVSAESEPKAEEIPEKVVEPAETSTEPEPEEQALVPETISGEKTEQVNEETLVQEEKQDPTPPEEAAIHVQEKKEQKYPSQWFALHVLSGQEASVKRYMESRVKTEELGDYVHDLIIPTERISEIKRGKKVETDRKLYPGYVFANMYLIDEDKKLVDRTWYFVKETPGVIGFADGDYPIPMRAKEVEAMLAQVKEREDKVVPKVAFELGDKVKVGDGPFQSQEGTVEEVDAEKGRLRVAVSIFGRSTPVELEYWQVEKL